MKFQLEDKWNALLWNFPVEIFQKKWKIWKSCPKFPFQSAKWKFREICLRTIYMFLPLPDREFVVTASETLDKSESIKMAEIGGDWNCQCSNSGSFLSSDTNDFINHQCDIYLIWKIDVYLC